MMAIDHQEWVRTLEIELRIRMVGSALNSVNR